MPPKLLCSVAALLVCVSARPQQSATAVLHSLSLQEQEYRNNVPGFTCSESVTSTAKRKERLLRRVEYQGDLRVKRNGGKSLDESFNLTSYMGKPVEPNGKRSLLLYLSGGLEGGLMSFFQDEVQRCFDAQVMETELIFAGTAPMRRTAMNPPIQLGLQ